MIGRKFVKRLRPLYGRSETISTRFELDSMDRLVEYIVVETHDPPTAARVPSGTPNDSVQRGTR